MVAYFRTPGASKFRILVAHDGVVRRFLSVELATRGDGSLYVIFDRSGLSEHSTFWTEEARTPIEAIGQSKGFRVSYHPTGRVHSNDLEGGPVFNEPLFAVTRPNHLVTISIPSVDRLDAYEDAVGEQAVIALPNGQRLNLALSVCPSGWSSAATNTLASANWAGLFELCVAHDGSIPPDVIPEGHEQHFIYLRRDRGFYDCQPTTRDDAFVRFHQRIAGHRDLLIYGPNGSGEYLMVFAVPMRIAPIATITPQEQGLVAHITKATNHYLRYQIRRANGELIKAPVIVHATLDARL